MIRRDAGYTLLELLVALAVFGLVLAGIGQAFRFGLTAWSAGSRELAAKGDMPAVEMALRGMIAQAVPGSMTGRAGGLAFTTHLPEGAGVLGGLADTAIELAPGGRLLLRYRPHPAGIPLGPPPPPRDELLAQGVDRLEIRYLAPQDHGGPVWTDSWMSDDLPLLIRIHFGFGDGRSWPDLVAAPAGSEL